MRVVSVIVAAGKGERFGSKKQFEKINGKMVLDYSVEILSEFGEVVIVASKEDLEFVKSFYPQATVVEGGKERMHSVYNGLKSIKDCDIVLIHDAARPLIYREMVSAVIDAAGEFSAAIPVIGAFETLKRKRDGFVVQTIDRSSIVISQTPQGFEFKKLLKALNECILKGEIYTDESAVWEKYYGEVKTVEGSRKNIKITTKEDLELVRCLLG
ncbi:2-C-methyl-D-erythritol 4-phosphate cytidylyltransferase [Hippea alviniae]|uniref:2-C-methyl-D-erythritol 4-phosphate cytidylyltransferase n=1 Tax=Hippea alviniae TaxID=1279027 RepID=UPI0003B54B93|nr:2-C-methyl-D-erythritol 4-phosphate cytidylyltransferase [Hippea alviniae]